MLLPSFNAPIHKLPSCVRSCYLRMRCINARPPGMPMYAGRHDARVCIARNEKCIVLHSLLSSTHYSPTVFRSMLRTTRSMLYYPLTQVSG